MIGGVVQFDAADCQTWYVIAVPDATRISRGKLAKMVDAVPSAAVEYATTCPALAGEPLNGENEIFSLADPPVPTAIVWLVSASLKPRLMATLPVVHVPPEPAVVGMISKLKRYVPVFGLATIVVGPEITALALVDMLKPVTAVLNTGLVWVST